MDKRKVIIHADGAASPNPGVGGWACILFDPAKNYRKEISGFQAVATNNQMELTSVIEAFKALKMPCEVTLYSDSQYVVNAFNQGWLNGWQLDRWRNAKGQPVKNIDLWKELLSAIKPHDVTWVWCRGHNGNVENERCDTLAVEAIEKYRSLME